MKSVKSSIILFLSFLFFFLNSYGQSTKLTGIVIDESTGEGIPFVHFSNTSNQGVGFISSEFGSYEFHFSLDSRDTFSLSAVGYKTLKASCLKLMETDTVYMERKSIKLSEFSVSAKSKTAKEVFEDALENFNSREYRDQSFIAGYEELIVSNDRNDTSFLRANCVINGYSPKENTGIFNSKFKEKVALLEVDSIKLGVDLKMMNHLLHMTQETKVNDIATPYKGLSFEISDTLIDETGHVILTLIGGYSNSSHVYRKATIDVTNNTFLELTHFFYCKDGEPAYYRAIFSDYIDDGLPTRLEMYICRNKPVPLDKIYKGVSVGVTLTLHEKVKIPLETRSWVEGSMFDGEIDLELKKKLVTD